MACCPAGSLPYLAADHKDEGRVGEADGVSYYQVGESTQGLLLIPDIWGWNGGRTRAIADDLAKKAGLSVWVPKLLEAHEGGTDGDGLPPDYDLGSKKDEFMALGLFEKAWSPEKVVPKVEKVVAAMKETGIRRYGGLGFCWGGWIVCHLSTKVSGSEMVCGIIPHPSVHLEGVLKGDPGDLAKKVQCPLALFPAGTPDGPGGDPAIYDKDGSVFSAVERKFPGRNVTQRFSDQVHGWVVRGAIKDGEFKAGDGEGTKNDVAKCVGLIEDFLKQNSLWQGMLEMKVTTKKSPSFYVKSASTFLTGLEAREAADGKEAQEAKPAVDVLTISGLGDAVNSAVAAASKAVADGVGVITKVDTSYPEMPNGKGCPHIVIVVKRKA